MHQYVPLFLPHRQGGTGLIPIIAREVESQLRRQVYGYDEGQRRAKAKQQHWRDSSLPGPCHSSGSSMKVGPLPGSHGAPDVGESPRGLEKGGRRRSASTSFDHIFPTAGGKDEFPKDRRR